MMKRILEVASKHPLFSSMNETELSRILTAGNLRSFPKDSFMTLAGDVWPYLFLMVEGSVRAVKESSEGRSLLISSFDSGDVFWGVSFFDPKMPMPVNLEVRETTQALLWERKVLLPFFLEDSRLSWQLSCLLVTQNLRASSIIDSLAFQPVAGRVAKFLLEQSSPDQGVSPRSLTLDEMAAHIGTTREVVCRYLRNFSEGGLIDITRTDYNITDRQGLLRLTKLVKG